MASRVPFVCGNWKMNTVPSEAGALARAVAEGRTESRVEVAVAPPACALPAVAQALAQAADQGATHPVKLAAQNVHAESSGAFTGEVAPPMLVDLCVEYVILGHSERRTLFGETDELVASKVVAALSAGLKPILCLGESLEDRDGDRTLEVVGRQLGTVLGRLPPDMDWDRLVLAYEPVWAIGTGRTATPDQAQQVHAYLRRRLSQAAPAAAGVRIQYGGSVKPGNAAELFGQPDIDGGLIGGASLEPDDFLAIVAAAA